MVLTCVTPCCPAPVSFGIAVMIFPGAPVPGVTTLVVIIVMGDLTPGLLVRPSNETGNNIRKSCELVTMCKKQICKLDINNVKLCGLTQRDKVRYN